MQQGYVVSFQYGSHYLSLTLAKAERSLTLWATGAITIEAVETSRTANKGIAFKPTLNKSTGKVSATAQSFNEANWGPATCAFIKSSRTLTPERLWEVMNLASTYAGAPAVPGTGNRRREPVIDVDSNNARASLVDLCEDSEGDSEESEESADK